MIYCCHTLSEVENIIPLMDNNVFTNCRIEVGRCRKCKSKIAQVIQYNINTQKIEIIRKPSKTKLDGFISYFKKRQSQNIYKAKYGNKSNMAFVYGKNLEKRDRIEQYSVDFNGTEILVKTIWKEHTN